MYILAGKRRFRRFLSQDRVLVGSETLLPVVVSRRSHTAIIRLAKAGGKEYHIPGMRPHDLTTRIFLDGADPEETRRIIAVVGFLDGQTTNPTLVAKNPVLLERISRKKPTQDELYSYYRGIVEEISSLIPEGSVSIEVYADETTEPTEMLKKAEWMNTWIPNAHIKFPTTRKGLAAARMALQSGIHVNMTLCFSQAQAAAVYAATAGATPGDVFVSPFIGRLDDRGQNGMDLIRNIIRMYRQGDGHVHVLAASVRTIGHFNASLRYGADIITAPYKLIAEWADAGRKIPQGDYSYDAGGLAPIAFAEIDLRRDWTEYDIRHELTDQGIEKFAHDWNGLIGGGDSI